MESYTLDYRLKPLMSLKGISTTEAHITGIQLFEFDIDTCYQTGRGMLSSCRYGLLQINCGTYTGWGECVMSANDKHFDMVKWASFLHRLKGMTLREALATTRLHRILWGENKADMTLTALLDVRARMKNKFIAAEILMRTSTQYLMRNAAIRGNRKRICHIHPGDKSSLIETMAYAKHLWLEGYSLEIHKDYLIGPACTALKLLSHTLEATWQENEEYPEPASLHNFVTHTVGTGFDLESKELFQKSSAYYSVLTR
ncbi:hypothetical protein OIN60_02025 [Paenibacillus sp. P96]|uniref:Uncharacterized protein n=1 Tax=Paenibacillus zeirhizosphaerae TaxID=2987519 RepID=A0ABT9FLF6_9BACL|nr:hypothetical protein [Paenibacillus sp. P96]MDP4095569.1 hypothetical protein [Paenibacillus sp. P96]